MSSRFPSVTHVAAPLVVATSWYASWIWERSFNSMTVGLDDIGAVAVLTCAGLLVVAAPATLLEVILLAQFSWQWPAHVVVVLSAWFGFVVSHFLASLSKAGGSSMTVALIVPCLLLYVGYALLQARAARWILELATR